MVDCLLWRRRLRSGFAAALVTLAFLSAPTRAETLLRARLDADILSSEPGDRRDENTDAVLLHILEGLVALREDGSVGPMLASRWDISGDGRTYTFTLRTDVVFHNGAPLTSAEVVWSLQRYLRRGSRWRCRLEFSNDGIGNVVSITAADVHTVVVVLDRAAPLLLKTLARTDCTGTGILHPDSVGPDGVWRSPIGTGPFRLGEWRHNQYIDLIRFQDYAALSGVSDGYGGGKRALVDRIRLMVIPDSSAASAALLRGALDVLDNISPTELGAVRNRPDVKLETAPTTEAYVLLLQTNDPLLGDVRLRQALALTIDTAGLTKAITWGASTPNNSPVPAPSPFYSSVERPLRRPDLAVARRLVKESGYQGQPIKLLTNRRHPQMFDAAVLIQAMALQAGINLQIETLDWAAQLARYGSGGYQAMAFSFSARLDPSLSFGVLIGDKTLDPRKVWNTPRARELLKQSIETGDPGARQAIFDALHRDFLAEVPAVELYNTARSTAVRSNVTGYRDWAGGLQRLWGVGVTR